MAIRVERGIGAQVVIENLAVIMLLRGGGSYSFVQCPAFAAMALLTCAAVGARKLYIEPGSSLGELLLRVF